VCGARLPAFLSLRKVVGTPQAKLEAYKVAAFEGLSLSWVDSVPFAVKASKELLAPE
jgi:hypothetical protein